MFVCVCVRDASQILDLFKVIFYFLPWYITQHQTTIWDMFFFFKASYANPRDEIKPNAPCGAMGCHWYWFHASINIKTMGPFRTAEWLDGFLQKHPKHVELSAPRQPTLQEVLGIFGGQILRMIHQISGVYMVAKLFIPLGASSTLTTEAAGPQDSRLGRPQWFAKAWPTQSWQPGRCRWRSWYSGRFGYII